VLIFSLSSGRLKRPFHFLKFLYFFESEAGIKDHQMISASLSYYFFYSCVDKNQLLSENAGQRYKYFLK
jgi:hypothetical protein